MFKEFNSMLTFLKKRETQRHQMPRGQKIFAIFTFEEYDCKVLY